MKISEVCNICKDTTVTLFREGEFDIMYGEGITKEGELIMLWSTYCETGYAITYAESLSEGVLGPWKQQDKPLFDRDGGHGMLFDGFDGNLYLILHSTNVPPNERPRLFMVKETDDGFEIVKRVES